MNNILLCTDCSENAKKAVEECLLVFKDIPTNYTLLYTYCIEMNGLMDLVAYNDILKTKVNNLLTAELSRIKKLPFAHNINITAKAVFGKTENVVQRLVTQYKFDLVVLGNQGMNYNKSLLFGSTTEKLIYDIKSPKLIIPNELKKNSSNKQMVIVQEQELNNDKWWSTVSAFSKSKNMSFNLVILPNEIDNNSTISIPSFIEEQISTITNFSHKNYTDISDSLHQLIQVENPALLHLNVVSPKITNQLLKNEELSNSVYNSIPFFIQPLHS